MRGHETSAGRAQRPIQVMVWGDRKAVCLGCRFVALEGAVMRCTRCRAGAASMCCAVAAGSAGLCGLDARYFEASVGRLDRRERMEQAGDWNGKNRPPAAKKLNSGSV